MICCQSLKMPKIKIKQVPFGIASRSGNTIYVHKDLKAYDNKLYVALIVHERLHSEGYSRNDIYMDLANRQLTGVKFKYYMFVLTHPSCLTELLPFWCYEGIWQFNPTMLGFWVFALVIGAGLWM